MTANGGGLTVVRDRQDPDAVEALLRSLPQWFGIEEAIRHYVEDASTLPTYLAVDATAVVGVLLMRRHYPVAAEVHLMAVAPTWHRHGIGRLLLQTAETDLCSDGVRWLQVKTLGPSKPSTEYARTRAFYQALGFEPLEELHGFWGDNPCLIMVKEIRRRR